MPSQHPRPLKYRELIARLAGFGVVTLPGHRGKGSETILFRPFVPHGKQGWQYPIKNHGPGTEIKKPVIAAALRVLQISPDDFWAR